MQVTRLDTVQGLGNVKTATIIMEALQVIMEALREQALHWALFLQDKDPIVETPNDSAVRQGSERDS
jgi:hypothetical protein